MTAEQLKTIEAELQKRGYKKWTTALTSSEDWAWFKSFDKEKDEDGYVDNESEAYKIVFGLRENLKSWKNQVEASCTSYHYEEVEPYNANEL